MLPTALRVVAPGILGDVDRRRGRLATSVATLAAEMPYLKKVNWTNIEKVFTCILHAWSTAANSTLNLERDFLLQHADNAFE